METTPPPTQAPVPAPVAVRVKQHLNKWALASLITLLAGSALIVLIGLIYTIVIFSSASSEQVFWIIFAIFVLPVTGLSIYGPLVAVVSFILGIISIVKGWGKRNVLGIVMTVFSGILLFGLPNFFNQILR